MDAVLAQYREILKNRTGQTIAEFAPKVIHTAPILALLQSPANSGAARSLIVQVHNDDPTARRTRKMINRAGLQPHQYVIWNFYASIEATTKERRIWEHETEGLIATMRDDLKVVLVFGNDAWLGMRDVELPKGVPV